MVQVSSAEACGTVSAVAARAVTTTFLNMEILQFV